MIRVLPQVRDRSAVLQPLAVNIDIDPRVLGFACLITLATVIMFGLPPALSAARIDVATVLQGNRGSTRQLRALNLILLAQVGLCTCIVVGAALLVETLERLRSMNPGFDRDHVVTFTIDPTLRGYKQEQCRALGKALLSKASSLPGVDAASLASRGLMRGTGMKGTYEPAGTIITPKDFLNTSSNAITPGYFRTMGIRVLSGRDFNWFDHGPKRVIVNETFARRFFPGRDPLGKSVGAPGPGSVAGADFEIIGVVNDAKYRSLREPIPPTVYNPATDGFNWDFVLHVRTAQNPVAIISSVRQALRSLDPEMPFVEIHTLREEVETSLWQERLLAVLSTIFGAIAAILVAIGLYGALDYAVKSRTREIGIRLAMGAKPTRIVQMLLREVLVCTAGGFTLGLCVFAVAAIWVKSVLFEVSPYEPAATLIAVLLIFSVSILAAAPAAYHAICVDPASALRVE
jgi:predicted permease